ncbi:MAG TPA: HAMP domain-containing sensor histidine kinase [Blastocatellia bacterium]|jgi:signal transduction histidine kinase|nr:HAMP domain-containing sensor histidine kinase [Blastocatellia bacterium]
MEGSAISRIRAFLKRRAFAIGGLAVTVPLLVIIFLQYQALTTLNKTLPAYRRQLMRQYLMSVVEDFSNFYRGNAERALAVPLGAIDLPKSGVIKDDYDCEMSQRIVTPVAEHFKKQDFKGVKSYFIAVATEHEGVEGSEIFFYDPVSQAMIRDYEVMEMVAIKVACAPYMVYIRRGSELIPQAQSVDRDPRARLMVKPILNERNKVVAVAGMTIDFEYFLDTVLPEAIRKSLPEFLPPEDQDPITSLYFLSEFQIAYDGKGTRLALSEGEKKIKAEAYQPLISVFSNSSLSVRLKNLTAEQFARRNFMINLSLWIVMTLALIAAVALMLRTASREMKLTQMKADFVSNVSHELRTPLASIRVLAELLNLGRVNQPDRVREYGAYIESEGRRLTNVINNILDFSRIESGRKLFQFESCDLKELVNGTLDAFAVHLKHNGFTLSYEAPQTALPQVVLDPDAIALALTNLLDNAIKYSGDVKEINVSVTQSEGFVAVAVSDRGIGIAADEHERIFEKFYRIGASLVHDVKGSGLGLSLVKHIVVAHQGKITVRSKPGEGSTFTIHLPVADQQSEHQAGLASSDDALKGIDGAGYKFTG